MVAVRPAVQATLYAVLVQVQVCDVMASKTTCKNLLITYTLMWPPFGPMHWCASCACVAHARAGMGGASKSDTNIFTQAAHHRCWRDWMLQCRPQTGHGSRG